MKLSLRHTPEGKKPLANKLEDVSSAKDLVEFLQTNPDPYAGLKSNEYQAASRAMFEAHPLPKKKLIKDIESMYHELLNETIRGRPIRERESANKIISAIIHEEVVDTTANFRGFRRGENEQTEKDVVCTNHPELSLEVKGNQEKTGLKGNKSYAVDNAQEGEGKKSRYSFYLVVNYEPPTKKNGKISPEVHRVGFAYLSPDDWETHKKDGKLIKGQAVSLKPDSKNKVFNIYED